MAAHVAAQDTAGQTGYGGVRRTRSDGGATVFFSFFLKILFGDASQVSRLGEPWREVGFESGHVYESRVLAGLTSLLVGAWSMAKEKFGEEITLRYAITRNYVTLRYVTFPEPRLRVTATLLAALVSEKLGVVMNALE